MEIDIIIPLYKPGKELFELLDRLNRQTLPVKNIILMNTEEKYFTQLVYGTDFSHRYQNVKVFHLSKREFDHGRTRRKGVTLSDAPVFVMMTQDAMPADEFLLENLIDTARRYGVPLCAACASLRAKNQAEVAQQRATQAENPPIDREEASPDDGEPTGGDSGELL